MKRTVSINLNNQNFQIEEDAYNKLATYLESIKRHCGVGADAAEVIADIENSLAEKFKLTLTPYKEIITIEDVHNLIKIMGTVEDFDREVGGVMPEESETNKETAETKTKRKLYRDMDNAVIGGVASGLGNYFDVDPVLFRIIFIALIFAGGSAFPVYILLWIAMPEAKTAYQKLEMQGQTPTLAAFQNLSRAGKQLQENWKKRWEKRSAIGKLISLPLVIVNGLFSAVKEVWVVLWPVIRLGFGLVISVISFIGLGAVGVGSLMLILYSNSPYQISFVPIYELTAIVPYNLMVIAGFLSLAIPALLIFIGGVSIIRKKSIINLTVGSIMLGVWMVAGICFSAFSLRYAPEIINKFDNNPLTKQVEQVVDMEGVQEIEASGNLVNIYVRANTSTPATLSGRQVDINNIELKREGNKLIMTEKLQTEETKACANCQLWSINLNVATSSSLNIQVIDGASVYDETMVEEEREKEESGEEKIISGTVEQVNNEVMIRYQR